MICLAAGALVIALGVESFTLVWEHSVERTLWEEDFRLVDGHLAVIEARVKGSGAGMEPGHEATLSGGWWRYRPNLPPIDKLTLSNSATRPDWRLCLLDGCRPLSSRLGTASTDVIELRGCTN